MKTSKTALACLLLIYGIWGFNWVVMRCAADYFTPALFVAMRFSLGAIILLAVCGIKGKLIPPRNQWKWIALTGVLTMAFNNLMIQTCTKYIGAGLTALVDYTQSVFVCILAVIFLKEKFTGRKIGGILLSIVGLAILMNINISGNLWAIFLDLGAAALWGISNVIVKAKLTGGDMVQYTAWQMAVGAIVMIAYNFLNPPTLAVWTGLSITTVLYNGILGSAIAFVLFNYLLTHMEAGKVSIAIMATPAIGVISGVLVLGEPMTIQIAIGMIILFSGIILVLWNKKGLSH